jgi:hypothetical protein
MPEYHQHLFALRRMPRNRRSGNHDNWQHRLIHWDFGAPWWTRTTDPQLRRLLLYPTELRAPVRLPPQSPPFTTTRRQYTFTSAAGSCQLIPCPGPAILPPDHTTRHIDDRRAGAILRALLLTPVRPRRSLYCRSFRPAQRRWREQKLCAPADRYGKNCRAPPARRSGF